jgi:RNA polymerase sigma-70 factor (ECF subfamily)
MAAPGHYQCGLEKVMYSCMCQSYEPLALIEFMDRLYSYAMVLTRDADDAQDILEDTYVRAIANISHLGPDSNIAGWLATILRNVWCNQVRDRDITQRSDSVDVKQSLEQFIYISGYGINSDEIVLSTRGAVLRP